MNYDRAQVVTFVPLLCFMREDTMKNNRGKAQAVLVLLLVASLSILVMLSLVAAVILKDKKKNTPVKPGNQQVNSVTLQTPNSQTEEQQGSNETGTSEIDENNVGIEISFDNQFYSSTITDSIFERINGKSFKDDTPVLREDLRYIHVLYNNAKGDTSEGEIIVHKVIAVDVLSIFKTLYDNGYVIENMSLVDEYSADDNVSMMVNNSSGFNTRKMTGSDVYSLHSYGLAIDVNPLYNPYVNGDMVLPASARGYVDRRGSFPMKFTEDDFCVRTFVSHGFVWGGSWANLKDYMHFEYVTDLSKLNQE